MAHRRDVADPTVLQVDVLQGPVAREGVAHLQRRIFPEVIPGGVQVMQKLVVAEALAHGSSTGTLDAVPTHVQFSQPQISTRQHLTNFFTSPHPDIVLSKIQLQQPGVTLESAAYGHCSLVTASVLG